MEKKFSVVIPTMYKSTVIFRKLLQILDEDPAVSEIIVIENSEKPKDELVYSLCDSKVKKITPEKNLYVNPSWNLGVANCSEDNVAILNDDIIIPDNLFTNISIFDLDSIGVIGACDYLIQETKDPQRFKVRYCTGMGIAERIWGYGIMMIMKKTHYTPIPEDLLIWAGDDYLFHKNKSLGRQNGVLMCPIQTIMSSTSSNPDFDKIKDNDMSIYEKKYKIGF